MYKKLTAVILLICSILMFASCSNKNHQEVSITAKKKLNVTVSFNAMREFAYAIGKDKINITTMIPDGTEPHDFDPKPRDMSSLNSAKIFIYSGFGMESWADKVIKAISNKNLITVDASKGFTPISNSDPAEVKEHGQYDPHIWLSLKGAENQSKNIKDAFIKADPSNSAYYEKNYNEFIKELNSLYNEYKNKFKIVHNKNFVTGHAAFAYLCRDFGLVQNSVEDVFADGEPGAQKLNELIEYCKKNKIKTVFVEDMVSPKVSNTLANEVGAKVEKIHTEESKEAGKDYIQCMKENLNMIYNSLK